MCRSVRDAIWVKHYAYSTEKTYVHWAKRFVLYHKKRHPLEMREKEISEFLTYLTAEKNVAVSTQNQALSALLFMYREVLHKDLALPPANHEWIWYYVFPATRRSQDPRSDVIRRYQLHENAVQKAVKRTAKKASIAKRVTPHIFLHSLATRLLESVCDIHSSLSSPPWHVHDAGQAAASLSRRSCMGYHWPRAEREVGVPSGHDFTD